MSWPSVPEIILMVVGVVLAMVLAWDTKRMRSGTRERDGR